jgi:hypothetical protein
MICICNSRCYLSTHFTVENRPFSSKLYAIPLLYEDLVYLTVKFTFKLFSFKSAFFITKLKVYNITPSVKHLGIDFSYNVII